MNMLQSYYTSILLTDMKKKEIVQSIGEAGIVIWIAALFYWSIVIFG